MPPFRQPVSDEEDSWSPPEYAKSISESPSEWKPPEYATAVKEEKKPSEFKARASKALGEFVSDVKSIPSAVSKFADEHPKIKEAGRRLLEGSRDEDIFSKEDLAKGARTLGPEFQKIPGVGKATDWLQHKIDPTESPWYSGVRPFIAGAWKLAGGAVESASDPRAMFKAEIHGLSTELPIRQSREIPYRMAEETTKAKPADISLKADEIPVKQTPKAVKEIPKDAELPKGLEEYDKKQRMAQPLSDEELIKAKTDTPIVKQKTFNPFEKPKAAEASPEFETKPAEESQVKQPTAKYMYDWPDMATETQGPEQYQVEGGRLHGSSVGADTLRKEGIEIPEKTAEAVKPKWKPPPSERVDVWDKNSQRFNPDTKMVEDTGWKPPEYAKAVKRTSEEDLTKGFGGSGHPENADYTSKVLGKAGKGTPGLNIEPIKSDAVADLNTQHVVYRNQAGEPIAAAKIVKDRFGKNSVMDLAADKSKGLLTGRAMKAIGDKLKELGATESAGTTSPDAMNFIQGMKDRMSKAADIKAPLRDLRDIKNQTPHGNWMDVEHLDKLQKAFGELKDDPVQKFDSPESRVAADKLKESINKEGIIQPIRVVVDDSRKPIRLSEGRHRIEALKDLRFKDAPVKLVNEAGTPLSFADSENAINKLKVPATEPQGEVTQMHGGLGGVGGETPKQPSTGPHGPVLDKLFSSLEESKGLSEAQSQMYKKEQAKRFAAFAGVKEEGVAGAAKSLSKLKGQYEKIEPLYGKLQLEPQETDQLFTAVKQARITEGEKARGYTALFKLMNGESVPQRNELAILDEVFGNGFANRITEMHGGIGAVGIKVGKTANTMKSLLNSLNIAAPILHGLPMVNKPEFWAAGRDMIKFMGSKEAFNAAQEVIRTDPDYLFSRDSGLFTAKIDTLGAGEEDFANSYVGNLPGIKQMVGFSQRGYVGFLNELRFKSFKNLLKNARDMGEDVETVVGGSRVPTKLAKDLAKFINNATDRGSLGKLEKIATELNYVLWSPRRLAARATMLNPMYYKNLEPFAKKQALKALFAQAAAGTAAVTLGALAGGKTSLKPDDPLFMKVQFGSHVLNPLGPTQSIVVATAKAIDELHRMGTGQKAKFGEKNIAQLGGDLLRNRESPLARLADEIATSRQIKGDQKEGDISTLSPPEFGGFTNRFGQKKFISAEIRNSFTPIFVQDVQELLKSDATFAESIGLAGASAIGVGVQPTFKKKSKFSLGSMGSMQLR